MDFSLDENVAIQTDEAQLVLQQIDILFDTKPKEVLGQEKFGTTYERYLYDLKLSNEELEHVVLSDLNSLNLLGFYPEVKVHLLQGTEQDIALIDITLTKDGESYNQIYKIS